MQTKTDDGLESKESRGLKFASILPALILAYVFHFTSLLSTTYVYIFDDSYFKYN